MWGPHAHTRSHSIEPSQHALLWVKGVQVQLHLYKKSSM